MSWISIGYRSAKCWKSITNAYSTHFVKSSGLNAKAKQISFPSTRMVYTQLLPIQEGEQEYHSALHILSGCQHTQVGNMITERHNLACSMISKAISRTIYISPGFLGSCFVCMDICSSNSWQCKIFRILIQLKPGNTKVTLSTLLLRQKQVHLHPFGCCIGCSHLCEN